MFMPFLILAALNEDKFQEAACTPSNHYSHPIIKVKNVRDKNSINCIIAPKVAPESKY